MREQDEIRQIEKLVELGADKLESMLESLKRQDHESAHYSKGSFQALKEVAWNLFGIDHTEFRADCMSEITSRQFATMESEVTAET